MAQKLYSLPLKDLTAHINPLGSDVWMCGELSPKDILTRCEENRLGDLPWNIIQKSYSGGSRYRPELDKELHASRIAFFVKKGIPENDKEPIKLCEVNGRVKVYEGRHRLAAAVIRRDETIEVAFSDQEKLLSFFPNAHSIPDSNISDPTTGQRVFSNAKPYV